MPLRAPRDLRISCARGLAPYTAAEVERIGLPVLRQLRTGVVTRGTWVDTWRLCLELRTAYHVYFPLAAFPCDSPKTLYHQIRKVPWEALIDPDERLTVESHVDHPSVDNSMFPNLQVKDAICDHLVKQVGRRPDSGSHRRGVVVHLAWHGDRATVSLSAAGRKLGDRGYRKRPHRAPLRETLAAAIVLESGWRGDRPLILPMCGSGTLAVEAALIGLDRGPGLVRPDFGFQHVKGYDAEVWGRLRAEARGRARRTLDVPIIASDLDPEAVEAARANATTAGVDHLIQFEVGDFQRVPKPDGPATVIVNPEYGARLGEEDALRETYERLGTWFKHECRGSSCFVLSGNRALTPSIGLRAARRTPFFNAEIECRLLRYDIWDDAGRPPAAPDAARRSDDTGATEARTTDDRREPPAHRGPRAPRTPRTPAPPPATDDRRTADDPWAAWRPADDDAT